MAKRKSPSKLARNSPSRNVRDKILIICEGQKTEKNYFLDLIKHYRIKSAKVRVVSSKQPEPANIFKKAKQELKKSESNGDAYDKIFCVFDKDEHSSYAETLSSIEYEKNKFSKKVKSNKKKKELIYVAVNSNPCFEFWLLLHFKKSDKPYKSMHNKSACLQVEEDLKKHIKNYKKNSDNIFQATKDKLPTALENSAKINQENINLSEKNRNSTQVCVLVKALKALAES